MKKKEKRLLLIVGGAVALYWLTRPKAAAPPVKDMPRPIPATTTATMRNMPSANAVSGRLRMRPGIGLPYMYNAEI